MNLVDSNHKGSSEIRDASASGLKDCYAVELEPGAVSDALRMVILLALLCAGFGCVSRPESLTASSTAPVSPAAQSTRTPVLTQSVIPVQVATLGLSPISSEMPDPTASAMFGVTPTHTPCFTPNAMSTRTLSLESSPTSVPIPTPSLSSALDLSVLRDITILAASSVITESAEAGKAEMLSEIWRIQADGSKRTSLLLGDVLEGNWLAGFGRLQLSHSGQELVFTQDIEHWRNSFWSMSLWTMNVDGSKTREWVGQIQSDAKPGSSAWTDKDTGALGSKPRPASPVWSPDDSQVAFVDLIDEDFGQVYVLDLESGRSSWISNGDVVEWSPDGQALAVRSNAFFADTHALQIVDLDGQVQTTVELSEDIYLWELDWSGSSGLIIALGQARTGPVYSLYLIDPLNGLVEVLAEDIFKYSPQWSPDGRAISFARKERDLGALYVLNLASRNTKLVMPQAQNGALWSPDGRFLLTLSYVDGYGLYIVSVSDGKYWKIPNISSNVEGTVPHSYDWSFSLR
jgi:hypothetical protein